MRIPWRIRNLPYLWRRRCFWLGHRWDFAYRTDGYVPFDRYRCYHCGLRMNVKAGVETR